MAAAQAAAVPARGSETRCFSGCEADSVAATLTFTIRGEEPPPARAAGRSPYRDV